MVGNSRTFPSTAQRLAVELYVNSGWTDVTSDLLYDRGIQITRGRQNESPSLTPSDCSFTVKNMTGNYSPRNPQGAYYGTTGRNTPMRLSIILAADAFTRTVSNGWGSTTDGWAWTTTGGAAADFAVSGTAATMAHTARATRHDASLQALPTGDVDVTYSVSCNVAAITGNSLYAGVRLRSDGTHFYQLALTLPSGGGTPSVAFTQADGTTIGPSTTIARLTYAANTKINIRVQAEGQIFRAKAWMFGTQAEPQGWDLVWSEGDSAELNDIQQGYNTIFTSVDG